MKYANKTIFWRKILAVVLCLGLLFSGIKLTTTLSAAEEMPAIDTEGEMTQGEEGQNDGTDTGMVVTEGEPLRNDGPDIEPVFVEDVTIQNVVSETQTEAETIVVDGILQLSAAVAPENADETTVTWSVTAGSDYIKLYKTDDCTEELGPEEAVESGVAVYAKGLAVGEATITVTTVGVDAEEEAKKTAACKVTVSEPEPEVICVEGVAIRKDEIDIEVETIYVDDILTLNAVVEPETAYSTNVLWSVTSGDDKIKLYKNESCSEELGPEDEVENGTAVYVKGLAAGEAQITVTTVGVDAVEEASKTATCKIIVSEPEPEPEPTDIEGVAIRKGETVIEAETIRVDDILELNAVVGSETAPETKLSWYIATGSESVMLYRDADCNESIGPYDEIEIGASVYVKGSAEGEAQIIVTTLEEDSKSAVCIVTVKPSVESVTIRNGETEAKEERVYVNSVLQLNAAVSPDNAYETNVTWSVTAGSDKIKLYKNESCTEELGAQDKIESGMAVYVKGLAAGEAEITVTTVGVDPGQEVKTATCKVTVIGNVTAPGYVKSLNYTVDDKETSPIALFCNETITIEVDVKVSGAASTAITCESSNTGLVEITEIVMPDDKPGVSLVTITAFDQLGTVELKFTTVGKGQDGKPLSKKLSISVTTDKTNWGQEVVNEGGIVNYVDSAGKTSAEIQAEGNGITWLREDSNGTSAWYGLDNSSGVLERGSRFWVRWLSSAEDAAEFSKYYEMLDEQHKKQAEDGKLWIFLAGVTKPDGTEVTNLSSSLPLYVQLGDDWDNANLSAVFISDGDDEGISASYLPNMNCPSGNKTIAKVTLKHFSPYAIYAKNTAQSEQTSEQTSSQTSEQATEQSTASGNPPTGDNTSPLYALVFMFSLGGLLILARKQRKRTTYSD